MLRASNMANGSGDDFTFCQKTVQDISKITLKDEVSRSDDDDESASNRSLWKDGLPTNGTRKEDRVGSLSFSVTSATRADQSTKAPTKQSAEDAGSFDRTTAEQILITKKPIVRTKVPFEKGYSQMDWLKLTRTHPDLAGLKGQSNRRLISMSEVKHNRTEGSMWTVLKGRVYNIYPYMKFHPGVGAPWGSIHEKNGNCWGKCREAMEMEKESSSVVSTIQVEVAEAVETLGMD